MGPDPDCWPAAALGRHQLCAVRSRSDDVGYGTALPARHASLLTRSKSTLADPGAFVRDNDTVVLRYVLSNGTVFSTESHDEGTTWSAPTEASQPAGRKCGSAWPKPFGSNEVVIPCAGGSARSTDGGRTWLASTKNVTLDPNVTGLGETIISADGRSPRSLTMFIRAGSHDGWLTHAVALSDDGGDTWGAARLMHIVGATCEGSVGRDSAAPPGQVLLAAPSGHVPFRLGRGNMSVYTLDTATPGAEPVSRLDVWPNAAGYSDFAQAKSGQMLLLFEGGGSVCAVARRSNQWREPPLLGFR